MDIKKSIADLSNRLDEFSIYLPEWRVKIESLEQTKT